METPHLGEKNLAELTSLLQADWDENLARWISVVGSPPLTTTAAASLSAGILATSTAWFWTGIYSLLVVLIPMLYVVWLFRQGQVTDLDLRIREQRTRPLLVTLAGSLTAWLVLYWAAAPTLLVALAGANGTQTVLFIGITRRWKISAHSAAAATLATLAWLLIGSSAVALAMSVPLIAWSRVRLRHHTIGQTVAGAVLGCCVLATIFLMVGA